MNIDRRPELEAAWAIALSPIPAYHRGANGRPRIKAGVIAQLTGLQTRHIRRARLDTPMQWQAWLFLFNQLRKGKP